MAYTTNSDSVATAQSNYYRSRLLSPHLPPADTATLREVIETPEGLLMHYQQKTHEACISRNATPKVKGRMLRALSWDLGNWSMPSSPCVLTHCPLHWDLCETPSTRSGLTAISDNFCLTAASVVLPAQDFNFHLSPAIYVHAPCIFRLTLTVVWHHSPGSAHRFGKGV